MFEKTKQRILRREASKPLHCIDTSVFLEMTLDTKEGKICQSHLANMGKGKYYKGVLPLSVLGEIVMVTFRDVNSPDERVERLRLLEEFARKRNIGCVVLHREDHKFIDKLMDIVYNLEEVDAEHLACAKRCGADVFITLDKKLIGSVELERELGIKIRSPSDFVSI